MATSTSAASATRGLGCSLSDIVIVIVIGRMIVIVRMIVIMIMRTIVRCFGLAPLIQMFGATNALDQRKSRRLLSERARSRNHCVNELLHCHAR